MAAMIKQEIGVTTVIGLFLALVFCPLPVFARNAPSRDAGTGTSLRSLADAAQTSGSVQGSKPPKTQDEGDDEAAPGTRTRRPAA